jgi:hypothetical protein
VEVEVNAGWGDTKIIIVGPGLLEPQLARHAAMAMPPEHQARYNLDPLRFEQCI